MPHNSEPGWGSDRHHIRPFIIIIGRPGRRQHQQEGPWVEAAAELHQVLLSKLRGIAQSQSNSNGEILTSWDLLKAVIATLSEQCLDNPICAKGSRYYNFAPHAASNGGKLERDIVKHNLIINCLLQCKCGCRMLKGNPNFRGLSKRVIYFQETSQGPPVLRVGVNIRQCPRAHQQRDVEF